MSDVIKESLDSFTSFLFELLLLRVSGNRMGFPSSQFRVLSTCASGPLLCTACPSSLSRRNCEEIKLELETLLKQINKFQVDRLIVLFIIYTSV